MYNNSKMKDVFNYLNKDLKKMAKKIIKKNEDFTKIIEGLKKSSIEISKKQKNSNVIV